MRKVTNSKSLENVLFLLLFYFYCCCLNRVCHFIDDDLKKNYQVFIFKRYICTCIYSLQTIVCIKIRNN